MGKDILETLSFLFKSIDFDPSKRVTELVHESSAMFALELSSKENSDRRRQACRWAGRGIKMLVTLLSRCSLTLVDLLEYWYVRLFTAVMKDELLRRNECFEFPTSCFHVGFD